MSPSPALEFAYTTLLKRDEIQAVTQIKAEPQSPKASVHALHYFKATRPDRIEMPQWPLTAPKGLNFVSMELGII